MNFLQFDNLAVLLPDSTTIPNKQKPCKSTTFFAHMQILEAFLFLITEKQKPDGKDSESVMPRCCHRQNIVRCLFGYSNNSSIIRDIQVAIR